MFDRSIRRRFRLAACLILVMLLLCACAQDPEKADLITAVPTQNSPLEVTSAPNPQVDYMAGLPEGYDPASEEGGEEYDGGSYDEMGRSVYAGATPIPLDPIDMPTATPRPELTFNYVEYDASAIGLRFEIPFDWTVSDNGTGSLVFTDPNTYDNVNASLTVSVTTVASSYGINDLKTDLENELAAIGQYNYTTWSPTPLESRTLVGGDGYYSSYRGVLYDGTIVRGRVHMAIIPGNRRITVTLNCPGWFNSSYTKVYTNFRNTVGLAE